MIERVLIISDMEFDYCAEDVSSFEPYTEYDRVVAYFSPISPK